MTDPSMWGHVSAGELSRVVVLSPHFDDAAMGAGLLLLRAEAPTVVTVFGGRPPAYPDPPSDWDALGGFTAGDDVVAPRREEDRAAMAVLGATPVWLEFADQCCCPAREGNFQPRSRRSGSPTAYLPVSSAPQMDKPRNQPGQKRHAQHSNPEGRRRREERAEHPRTQPPAE